MAVELGWRKCTKCAEMVFWGSEAGACPAGDSHSFGDSTSDKFIGIVSPIPDFTNLSTVKTTGGWRHCRFCQCMYNANVTDSGIPLTPTVFRPGGGPPPRVCPAIGGKGQHDASYSAHYLVPSSFSPTDAAARWLRAGWQECAKCRALFHTADGRHGGHCITDGKPHVGVGVQLFPCVERLVRLPLPSKAGYGKDVNLKVDTNSILGWVVVSQCTWLSATETRLSAQSKYGEEVFASLDFEMVDGPACAIRISVGGVKRFEILGIDVKDVTVPPTNLDQTLPCIDQDGTSDPDVEFAPGRNNGLILQVLLLGKLYPKNDNRVRLALNAPVGGFQDFELETQ